MTPYYLLLLQPSGEATISPTDVANAQAFGTHVASVDPQVAPAGHSNAQVYGTAAVILDLWIQPANGWQNAQAFGAAALSLEIAVPSQQGVQVYGTQLVRVDPQVLPGGFVNTSQLGAPTVSGGAGAASSNKSTQLRVVQTQTSVR